MNMLLKSCILSFVAAFVDTVGFIAFFGLFTAHVTGNFILIGSAIPEIPHSITLKLIVFPVFILAVALSRTSDLFLTKRGLPTRKFLLSVEVIFLMLALIAGIKGQSFPGIGSDLLFFAALCAAFAMGVQNALSRIAYSHLAPTTVMTGNVTQLVMDFVDWLQCRNQSAFTVSVKKFALPVSGFATGALAGGMLFNLFAFSSLTIPILFLMILIIYPER